jgi:hypothetical protein
LRYENLTGLSHRQLTDLTASAAATGVVRPGAQLGVIGIVQVAGEWALIQQINGPALTSRLLFTNRTCVSPSNGLGRI